MFFHTYHIYIELAALCDDDDILRMCDQRIQNERNKQTNEKKNHDNEFSLPSFSLIVCMCMCMCSIIFVVIIIIIDFGHMMMREKIIIFFSYKTIYYVCM